LADCHSSTSEVWLCIAGIVGDVVVDVIVDALKAGGPSVKLWGPYCSALSKEILKSFITATISG
jgi:hypothetical protein